MFKDLSLYLSGWDIVILRALHQAKPVQDFLVSLGAQVIILPTLEIVPVPLSLDKKTVQTMLVEADLLIATSPNAIHCAPAHLFSLLRTLPALPIVTMGSTTTRLFSEQNIPVFHTAAKGTTSEVLLTLNFLQKEHIHNKKVVLLAGFGGRTVIATKLQRRGADIGWLKVYRQQPVHLDLTSALSTWQQKGRYAFIATSVNILENLCVHIPKVALSWLARQALIVISPRIAETAKKWEFQHIFAARSLLPEDLGVALHTMAEVCDTSRK